MVTVEIENEAEFIAGWGRVNATIVVGAMRGVSSGCREGATEARSKHTFTNRSGELEKSITGRLINANGNEPTGEIVASKQYASFVENGRGPVVATNAKALRFSIGGQTIFRKRVKAAAAKPFMSLAFLKCERVIIREIEVGVSEAQRVLDAG